MDNYHTSLGIMKYLWRKFKADLSIMTMSGRVIPIGCKSGDQSAQFQKWSACCWTSCILQPIQFGQLGEYSGSTTKILLEYYQYYYYKPKTWAASTSLAHDLLAFASSGSAHLHISLSQSSHVLSFQSFVLSFNLNFHIQCCPPFSLAVFLLSLSQLLPLYHQSWLYCSSLYLACSLRNPK